MSIGMKKTIVALVAVFALSACATRKITPGNPDVALPMQWSITVSGGVAHTVTQDWWRSFGSVELDALIELARQQSLDVVAASARVRQAQAFAGQAGASLWPQLTASVQIGRQGRLGGDALVTGTSSSAGFSASYELDFWGKNQAARESANANVQASIFDRDTVQLTITARVADAWLLGVALHERIGIARLSLQTAERLLGLVEYRSKAGAASALELAQQRALVAAQRRVWLGLLQQIQAVNISLALLLGKAGGVAVIAESLTVLNAPEIDAGLPAALLTRRPDIARAEARLRAANANIDVARAAMWPAMTLSANIGASAGRLRQFLENPVYALAATLVGPIFDGGRLAAGRDLAFAQQEELLVSYQQTIVQAFADVELALNAVAGTETQAKAQKQELAQAQKAMALAESRYRGGAETLLTLLDAQRTLYAAQDISIQLKLARLQGQVALYRALGGGWD